MDELSYHIFGETIPFNLNSDKNISQHFFALPIPLTSSVVTLEYTKTITDNDDTGEENTSSGSVSLSSSDLEMCSDGGNPQICAIRVSGVTIPSGATITTATFDLTANTSNTGSNSISIYGEDVDNSLALATTTNNISNRTLTSNYTDWIPGSSSSGIEKTTTAFTRVVQEIIDRSGWTSGNAITFLFKNSGNTLEFNSRSSNSSPEPVININYIEGEPTVGWEGKIQGLSIAKVQGIEVSKVQGI